MLDKCNEISEILKIRFGMMLVGPAMSGKTTLLSLLKQAWNKLHELGKANPELNQCLHVESATFNPKSISIEELYGNFESVT